MSPRLEDVRRQLGELAALTFLHLDVGRDGLLIDGASDSALDPDGLAAHVPPMVAAAVDMGRASGRGSFALMVLEYGAGMGIVASLSADVLLLVLLRDGANLASLLYDLRRHRSQIAAIV